MIFLTVGTHEQPFNRLIKEVDELVKDGIIHERVFMQIGYSTYVPEYCEFSKFLSYKSMNKFMNQASVVICHGGPATFMKSLSLQKRTIVVPRLKKFDEHVNNHQLAFTKRVIKEGYPLELVTNITDLKPLLEETKIDDVTLKSHNGIFVDNLILNIKKM